MFWTTDRDGFRNGLFCILGDETARPAKITSAFYGYFKHIKFKNKRNIIMRYYNTS